MVVALFTLLAATMTTVSVQRAGETKTLPAEQAEAEVVQEECPQVEATFASIAKSQAT